MAITLRMNDEQEATLAEFMKDGMFETKSKAVLWLIENSKRLKRSEDKLFKLEVALRDKEKADKQLSEILNR